MVKFLYAEDFFKACRLDHRFCNCAQSDRHWRRGPGDRRRKLFVSDSGAAFDIGNDRHGRSVLAKRVGFARASHFVRDRHSLQLFRLFFRRSWSGLDRRRYLSSRTIAAIGHPTETAIRAVVTTRLMSFVSLLAVIACGLPIVLGYPLQPQRQNLARFICRDWQSVEWLQLLFLVLAIIRFRSFSCPLFWTRLLAFQTISVKALSSKAPLASQSAVFNIDSSAAGFDLCGDRGCLPRRNQFCGSLCPRSDFSSGRHGADRSGKLGRARSQRDILPGTGWRSSGDGAQHLRHVRRFLHSLSTRSAASCGYLRARIIMNSRQRVRRMSGAQASADRGTSAAASWKS